MNKIDFALILTCTINPVNIPNLVRNDPNMRLEDYKKSFNFWANHPRVNKIIFILKIHKFIAQISILTCICIDPKDFITFSQILRLELQ